jgi:thioredoxin reductase (NADPH)
MAERPVILVVDDDRAVIYSVARDLQTRYGDRFRVIPTDSGASALDALNQLTLRSAPVALIMADQRMPNMTGVELLKEAIALYPDVKRVLLTAYADTNAAIQAINDVQIDHYLLKPWEPPEERLYPVVDDVLEDWLASYYPPFEGVRIIGNRWSAATFQLKDFLARNLVPYHSIDVEHDPEATDLIARTGLDPSRLPIVILEDGTPLAQPTQQELASRIGLEIRPALPFYDLIIVGAGPSGLAGGVYGASEGLRTLMIERQAPGGQAGTSSRIENYLGFPSGLSGADLARRGLAQAKRLGAEVLSGEVVGVRIDGPYRIVQLADGSEVSCHALLIAAGVSYRRLDVPGVEALHGAGVYYGGALSEAIATRGERVFIVGGANSAGQAAIHFAKYARCVTMIVRGDDLAKSGMSRYLVDRIGDTPNIEVAFNSSVVEAIGEGRLHALRIANARTGGERTLEADDLFIFIGAKPYTTWLRDQVAVDGGGYVLTGPDVAGAARDAPRWPLKREPYLLETSVPGIFAAGDIRHQSIKRIASATGEGAMAIQFVHRYLSTL